MKTKLYTLITCLLMVSCITSYGQEIVNRFNIKEENLFVIGCDIQENTDGTLLIGTVSCNNFYLYNPEYLILKTTSNGEILNSLSINTPEGMNGDYFTSVTENQNRHFMLRNATAPDSYIIANHYRDTDNNYYFRVVTIDADLNVNDDHSVQVAQDAEGLFVWDDWLIDTQNDFIVTFWTDEVFHIMRIGLEGTIKTDWESTELFPPSFDYEYNPDTALWYSGFGIFGNEPLSYYKLGGYHTESETYPIHCYFFDENFNITGTHWFESYDGEILFSGGNLEHFALLDGSSYLLASEMEYPTNEYGSAVIKYDMNHNPICISPELGFNGYPLETEITDNTIYQSYVNFGSNSWSVSLACLDNELELKWDIALPGLQYSGLYGNSILTKSNGDIVIGFGCAEGDNTSIFVYTVRNTPANVTETMGRDYPFTLYPNPLKEQLTLNFVEGSEPESVELYDLAGRLVGTKNNGMENIDMSAMTAGVYMLRIILKDGTIYHEKILKE